MSIDFRCGKCDGSGLFRFSKPKHTSILPGYVDDVGECPSCKGVGYDLAMMATSLESLCIAEDQRRGILSHD